MSSIQENHQEWIDALLSGDYDQGMGQLRNGNNKFCCLGVLCDIFQDGEEFIWKRPNIDTEYVFGPNLSEGMPPDEILELVGLTRNEAERLAEANDDGFTFLEIVKMIEETT